MVGCSVLILIWAIVGPCIAMGIHWHPVVGVIAFLAVIYSLKKRGGLGCLIVVVWLISAIIAMFAVGGFVTLTSVIAWVLILLALGYT